MLYRNLLVVLLTFWALSNAAIAFDPEEQLLIVYTSDTQGYVEGCGWKGATGGLARRAGMINELSKAHKNILCLDNGDSFSRKKNVPELRAETGIEGMNLMHYDALNVGEGELSLGLGFLESLKKKAQFPFVTANIFKKKDDQPVGAPYLIKEFDDFKVGIIGVVSPVFFMGDIPDRENLVIEEPTVTLKKLVPEVRAQADVVILLAHVGKNTTIELVKSIPGIDVALIGHDYGVMLEAEVMGETILVQNSKQGSYLGVLALTVNRDGSIAGYENSLASLDAGTPADETVVQLLRRFGEKKAALDRARLTQIKERQSRRENQEQLKMTPEEYLEKLKKENKLMTPEEFLKMKKKE